MTPDPGERLVVGRVGRAHGLRGEVAVTFTSNRPERSEPGAVLYVGDRELVIDAFSIFPEWFAGPLDASLLGRARAEGRLDVRVHDLREHATDRHRSVDDTPYGGGAGMVLAPEPLFAAVETAEPPRPLLLLS